MNEIKNFYIPERYEKVDKDFLEFEEDMISSKDQEIILSLLNNTLNKLTKLENPHNSIILYLTGITDSFDFEKGRSDTIGGSPPDIDIDFDALDRTKAIDWVVENWGRDKVANIITHGTFKPKSIARSFYRVTEGSSKDMADLLKMIPPAKFGREATLEEIVEKEPKFKNYEPFYTSATKLEDMVSNFGIHAAGLVISDFPIHDVVPVWKNSKADMITQFDKKEVEDLGLIKFDFLSIDTLSIIKECVRLIKEKRGIDIDPWTLPDGDPKAYAAMHAGLLTGMFQVETSGKAKDLIQRIRPEMIPHVSDISALNRPGPAQAGLDEQYITNKNNGYPPEDLPDIIADILKDTYWTLVYQEQVMEIVSKVAGFSMRESDDIRRAMGKKDREFLAAYQQQFVDGAVSSGLTESYAEDLWEELLGFADYCFNKSHSVAYSIITYATAYLKANFSTEFFCALMTVRSQSLQPKTWAGKAPEYINEAKYFDVEINPPSVNGSDLEFSMRDGEIYFGLNAIRDVGKTAARSIVRTRGKTNFKDIYDFLFRVNGNKVTVKTFVSLIKAGAFDKMGYVRAELVEKSQDLHNYVRDIQEYNQRLLDIKEREAHNERMTEIIDRRNELRKEFKKINRELKKQGETVALTTRYEEINRELEEIEELKPRRLPKLKEKAEPVKPELQRQKSVALDLVQIMEQAHYIGCYIGAHPAAMIGSGFDKIKDCYIGQRPNLCGIVNSIKVITTRRGQKMAFMEIDDSTGTAELTVFSNVWSSISELGITPGCLLTDIQCKVDNEEPIKLIAFNLKLFRSPNE